MPRLTVRQQLKFVEKQYEDHQKMLISLQKQLNDDHHSNIYDLIHLYTIDF